MNAERHHRVMELFQRALDKKGPERDAFLNDTCGHDRQTLEEVRSLLKYHDPRTITPTHTLALKAPSELAASPSSSSSRLSQFAPRNWRPTNPVRVKASLIALALAGMLAALGYWLDRQVATRLRGNLEGQLRATLDSNVAALTYWLKLQEHEVQEWAAHPQFREDFAALVDLAKSPDASLDDLRASAGHVAILDLTKPLLDDPSVRAINAINGDGLMVLTSRDKLHERFRLTAAGIKLIAPVLLGQNIVLPPTRGRTLVENEVPDAWDDPIIVVGSPIRDADNRIIGGLFVSVDSGQEFTKLLDLANAGPHADTYAFGPTGHLLSASRYEKQLYNLGVIDRDRPGESVLHVQLLDPGVNLTTGSKSRVPREQQPLTKMAAAAVAGGSGSDLDGYRDYRGVEVVGAWKWLAPYGFGVATEIDRNSAYAVLDDVRRVLWSLFGLSVLFAGVAFMSSLAAFRLKQEIGAARQLGPYTLEELIGEGGMGKVYKARHALLRRPTAVKVLDGDQAGPAAVARFEREVQLASSLTHPNTVEIFDYGRTPDDVFFFAMEYLPGITLEGLVRRDGAIGTSRVLYIVRQVLGSLAEAHSLGLVHRDIKPANIMLCERGGLYDFVKVVDFGLAKDMSLGAESQITQSGLISGTPLYIAPECLSDPDTASPRSDVYALGAVMFHLLTGRDLFVGANPFEVLQKVSRDEPPRASQCGIAGIPAELDDLVFRCVAKNPDERPQSVDQILQVIGALVSKYPWTQVDARRWWETYEQPPAPADAAANTRPA